MKKNIEPIVSILIVCLIFAASFYVIVEAEKIFDKELSASVSKPFFSKPKGERGGLLVTKAKEQLGKMILSDCYEEVAQVFEQAWNQECQDLGLEDKCNLPRYIADQLLGDYQEAKDNCYNK
jgi:hypothetical protein